MIGRLVFLGTSGGTPTSSRGLPSVALLWRGELLLFDCGEGTQRQMMAAGTGFGRETRIFITHMHGDHILGIPGLLMTMSLLGRERRLEIYGPGGVGEYLATMPVSVRRGLTFPIGYAEAGPGRVYRGKDYTVLAERAKHGEDALAYAFVEDARRGRFDAHRAEELGIPEGPLRSALVRGETVTLSSGRAVHPGEVVGPERPGVKIVYSGDTQYSKSLVEFSRGADILVHDGTFDESLVKDAEAAMHSTCVDAARVASEAGVKKLYLFHVSARYRDTSILKAQASKVFQNTEVAEDLQAIDIT